MHTTRRLLPVVAALPCRQNHALLTALFAIMALVPPLAAAPEPVPDLSTTRARCGKVICCWPTNYADFALQATRRLYPRNPHKEAWINVTNARVISGTSICVTNLVSHWGRHYRLIKQALPKSAIYQIESGVYREVGGIWGEYILPLPATNQALVSLEIDAVAARAQMTFLDTDHRPAFPPLTNGLLSPNRIVFDYTIPGQFDSHRPLRVHYTVANVEDRLWISGSITSAPVCCDIPYKFQHQDVIATLLPANPAPAAGPSP